MLFFMQASKKIPFEDPNVLNLVRIGYILSNVAVASIYLYVQSKINAKKGAHTPTSTSHFTVHDTNTMHNRHDDSRIR